MEEITSREKILKKVRNALISKSDETFFDVDFESPIYENQNESLDITFAKEFTQVNGKFVYCENEEEFISTLQLLVTSNNWKNIFTLEEKIKTLLSKGGISYNSDQKDFLKTNIGITLCEFLVARLGSIVVSSAMASGRRLNVFPEIHLILAYSSQLVYDVKEALIKLGKKYDKNLPSMISVITGPSRTADIEKTLVLGAHGPKEVYLFLIEDTKY